MLDRAQDLLRHYAVLIAGSSAAILILLHLFWPERFRVDGITVALVALILCLPFLHLIRRIKIFDFEAEIEREEVASATATVQLVQHDKEVVSPTPVKIAYSDIFDLVDLSVPAAFAQLRQALTASLLRYLESFDPTPTLRVNHSPLTLARDLRALEAIEDIDVQAVSKVTTIANKAIHGAEIDIDTAHEAIDNGVSLLRYFDSQGWQKPEHQEEISDEAEAALKGALFTATTVVPLGGILGMSKKRVYTVTQAQLETLYERFQEWPEYLVALEPIRQPSQS